MSDTAAFHKCMSDPAGSIQTFAAPDDLRRARKITVEAWVHTGDFRPEAMQPIVSCWTPKPELDAFSAHDAGLTDGLDTVGFYGAAFDGRHVYFCPIRTTLSDRMSVHGHVLRYDTHKDFHLPDSYEAYDAGKTDGIRTVCYYGATFDGRFMYFTPRDEGDGYHSRVLRYDTHGPYRHPDSWSACDAGLEHSHQAAGFDGRFIYFCPGYRDTDDASISEAALSGAVLRLDTTRDFKDPSSYRVFDASALSEETVCYDGAAFDGRYIYFVPLATGVVLRYDTTHDFEDPDSWTWFDGKPLGMMDSVGAVYDGRFIYFAKYGEGPMVRFDTEQSFKDSGSWQVSQAPDLLGIGSDGFDGGFFDGRYVCFVPWKRWGGDQQSGYHCNWLRYDTRGAFEDSESWAVTEASDTDGLYSVGFNAGAYDGRFYYGAPLYDGRGDRFHGKILRCDTLGSSGTFSLRYVDYGHNGGLCAAVPGPSFLVNTTTGVRSIASHAPLRPGRHHLVGVYDGSRLKLFVDGALVAERQAEGELQTCDAPLSIGHIDEAARFRGSVEEVRISADAQSDEWVKAEYWSRVRRAASGETS